jgi:hypothetical protein
MAVLCRQFGISRKTRHRALHVVERYRLLDYEAASEAEERDQKEIFGIPGSVQGFARNLNCRGTGLQLDFYPHFTSMA